MLQQKELVNNISKLKPYAVHLTGNQVDAEDLVQATTLRALEKSHLFQEGTNLLSWNPKLCSICLSRNTAEKPNLNQNAILKIL